MLRSMDRRVWTAAELKGMSSAERRSLFRASIIRDLDAVPPEFLARVRARLDRPTTGIDQPDSS
jgi:hypothetical protein